MSAHRRAELPARKETRRAVIERDRGRCRCCGAMVGDYGHAHEIVYRSRGGDWLELGNVCLLCAECHGKLHAHLLEIVVEDPEQGANGPLLFVHTPRRQDEST